MWQAPRQNALTPVIRPKLAADSLTHVVEGVEVLRDGLIVLAL